MRALCRGLGDAKLDALRWAPVPAAAARLPLSISISLGASSG